MRVSGYSELRPASLPWVRAFPSHWTRRRLRFLLRDGYQGLKIGPFGSQIKLQDLSDSGFKIYGQENVIGRDFTLGSRYLDPAAFEELSVYEIKPMDLVVTMMGTSGRCAIVPDNIMPGIMDSHLVRLRTRDETSTHYLRYLIDESPYVRTQVDLLGKGSIMHGLNSGIIKNLDLLLPPPEEQDVITKFLDWKTGQIDALMDRKKELMEKLKEKRIAIITHAVTRGLNPAAPMRDSGIPWLGRVPKHWDMLRIGRMITLQRGVDITKDEQEDGEVPVVSSGGIASYHKVAMVKGPGVVVGRKGTAGALYYIESDFWPHDTTLYVREFWGNHPRFVYYKLMSMDLASYDTGTANPTVNRVRVHPEMVCWPPLEEQLVITDYLDQITQSIDGMIAKIMEAIDRLTEYRSALITAATTGKIDVRGIKIPHPIA